MEEKKKKQSNGGPSEPLSNVQIKITEKEIAAVFERYKEAIIFSSAIFIEKSNNSLNDVSLQDRKENILQIYHSSRILFKLLLENGNLEIEEANKGFSLVVSSVLRTKANFIQHKSISRTLSNIYQVGKKNEKIEKIYSFFLLFFFQKEPCIEETTLATKHLKEFRNRLSHILSLYPDHPILVLLLKIIDKVIDLPVSSPLMKVLNGIEFLIKKAQEWQSYASKEVSIQTHLDTLWSIVIRWRRIELDTWSFLLEERSKVFHFAAIKEVKKKKNFFFKLNLFLGSFPLTHSGGSVFIQY